MHYPEMWGIVQFSGGAFREPPHEEARWFLRRIYYLQRDHHKAHGRFASSLDLAPPRGTRLALHATRDSFEAVLTLGDGTRLRIGRDGRLETGE